MTSRWTVGDAMTPSPVTVDAKTTIRAARRIMRRFGIRHLPILDGGLIRMVSDRDLRVAELVFAKAEHPVTAAHAASLVGAETVRRVQRSDPLQDVVTSMFRDRVDAVLVLDGRSLVGILTTTDACRLLGERLRDAPTAPTRKLSA